MTILLWHFLICQLVIHIKDLIANLNLSMHFFGDVNSFYVLCITIYVRVQNLHVTIIVCRIHKKEKNLTMFSDLILC